MADTVLIFDFGAGAELGVIFVHHADVGFDAQHTFGHIAIVHAQILQDRAQRPGVGFGFFGAGASSSGMTSAPAAA